MTGEFIANIFLWTAGIYLFLGVLFVFPFQIKGIFELDENAKGGSIGFRIIIIPGIIMLWPFLLKKWIMLKSRNHD